MSFSSVEWLGKKTFEWLKVVSEVIFPRFWGEVCFEKCFRNFEIVVGSAVSEISLGTSNQNFKIPKTLFNTN